MSSATDTLKIKNLPKELSEVQKENFAKHFGAIKVKIITSRAKEKAVVFAKFETPEIAKNVMHRIHQIKLLNVRLCVEYAENDILQEKPLLKTVGTRDVSDSKFFKSFVNKINAFNDNVGFNQPPPGHLKYNYPNANRATINNIAHALATIPRFYTQVLHLMNKMNLPPPFAVPNSNLRSVTPGVQKPAVQLEQHVESSVLQNDIRPVEPLLPQILPDRIPIQLPQINVELPHINVAPPDQKLVVMQQIPAVSELPKVIHKELQPIGQTEVPANNTSTLTLNIPSPPSKVGEKRRKSSSESEIESDEEAKKFKEIIPEKRPKVDKKVVKRPKFILPPVVQTVQEKTEEKKADDKPPEKIEEVFEKVEFQAPPKKIELKVTTESLEQPQEPRAEETAKETTEVNFNTTIEPLSPVQDDGENEDDDEDDDAHPCITLEELKSNQITDFKELPLFQKYDPGHPTNKVYIKNCSKTVTPEDLEYIYNRYREEGTEEKPSEFNIRLMKEGRLKGQAFVTLDSVEMAEKAVKETHGFILKDKPLWVAYGKAGTKKK